MTLTQLLMYGLFLTNGGILVGNIMVLRGLTRVRDRLEAAYGALLALREPLVTDYGV